ncbi:hypothetical protein MMC24_005035 [Lignoscripta atroalba]|nr:hypothetical protein [Lignoscripta atroalba]
MADLEKLARDLLVKRPHKIEKSPKRIRVLFNKKYIIDSTQAKYVWEHPYYPQYYVPYDSLETNEVHDNTDSEEGFTILKIEVGQRSTDRVLSFKTGLLRGLVRLEFSSMDAWFEEEQQIYVHPKDPYKRIDIVQSSRTIKVEIEGTVIAESSNVMMLFETSLPARYYLPPTSNS